MTVDSSDQRATELGELAERTVRLAAALEAAENEAAQIRATCERLGVAGRLGDLLERLNRMPSDAAEALQDELDRLAGECHHPPVDAVAPHPEPQASEDRRSLAPGALHVACRACGQHYPVPASGDDALDLRTYRCPHCGHRDRYETWDHFEESE